MYHCELLQYVPCYCLFGMYFGCVCHQIVNAVPDELYIIPENLKKSNRCVVLTAAVDLMKENNKFLFLIWLQWVSSVLLCSTCKCSFVEFFKYTSAAAFPQKLRKPLAGSKADIVSSLQAALYANGSRLIGKEAFFLNTWNLSNDRVKSVF